MIETCAFFRDEISDELSQSAWEGSASSTVHVIPRIGFGERAVPPTMFYIY